MNILTTTFTNVVKATALAVVIAAMTITPLTAKSPEKVLMCHLNDEGEFHPISISERAQQAHLDHGDFLGVVGASDPCAEVWARAYLEDDGIEGYDPAGDIDIAIFIDANGDGAAGDGDELIAYNYPIPPMDFTNDNLAEFGDPGVPQTYVLGSVVPGDIEFLHSQSIRILFENPDWSYQYFAFRRTPNQMWYEERAGGFGGGLAKFFLSSSSQGGIDTIEVKPHPVGATISLPQVFVPYQTHPLGSMNLRVEIYPNWSNP